MPKRRNWFRLFKGTDTEFNAPEERLPIIAGGWLDQPRCAGRPVDMFMPLHILLQSTRSARRIGVLSISVLAIALTAGRAGAEGAFASLPSLKGVRVPKTPGLLHGQNPIVVDKVAAIQLGKALFWDISVGSDGIACASCHFHAGADRRVRNQLSPGAYHESSPTGTRFEPTASGAAGGPNYTLTARDFPFHQLVAPADKTSAVLFTTDDVMSSSGVLARRFQGVGGDDSRKDRCRPLEDPVFHSNHLNVRRVQARNAPTIINAAFNFRNFWDGRANNVFNGASPFGPRDREAGIWVADGTGVARFRRVRLANASLASLATAPAVNDSEMSCTGRTLPEVGRKLLNRRALQFQVVDPHDSVLGGTALHPSGKGLEATYADLIQRAFAPRFWSGRGQFGISAIDQQPYTQIEANFSFFFGLALQLYQQTLISDEAPFDSPRDAQGLPTGLNQQQKRGMLEFVKAQCAQCHKGPTLSAAAHPALYSVASPTGLRLVNRKTLKGAGPGNGVAFGLMDEGFANTSVVPTEHDPGIGGTDPFGNPLSFTEQYVRALLGEPDAIVDPLKVVACSFDNPFTMDFPAKQLTDDPFGYTGCDARVVYAKTPIVAALQAELQKPHQGRAITAIHGAFKIPSLRNVELTGPYMHHGGMKSLEEVIAFYGRGGNFANPDHFGSHVFLQGFTEQQQADIVAFLKSLTDERVRWERAPFDHPELLVPHGHGDEPSSWNGTAAKDRFLRIPAVGKEGRTARQGPLQPFEHYLDP